MHSIVSTKLESLFGWFVLLGLFILPFILLLAISIPGRIASGKRVTFDRARTSLLAALNDTSRGTVIEPKQYGSFAVHRCTNTITMTTTSYLLAFCTAEEYQFAHQGMLAVTTNRQFIWLDYRRGASHRLHCATSI